MCDILIASVVIRLVFTRCIESTRNSSKLTAVVFSAGYPTTSEIVAYIEEIDSDEERRGGATRRSLNPGKEGPREEERRGRFASSRGPGAEQRQRRGSAEETAPSSKKSPNTV
ncbi:hypothetical protein NQZ68_000510 [Dissostichus eleginoides]|nr:hypothetical protein NQZ68_000510 [Dissostichus eleginoides]